MMHERKLAPAPALLAGGLVGATLRWSIGELGWSTSTTLLLVNSLGCLVLGAVVRRWPRSDDPIRLALGLGFCGGLTTFSALALEAAVRFDAGDNSGVAALLVASVLLGFGSYGAGRRLSGASR